jgi:homospermidine synthase
MVKFDGRVLIIGYGAVSRCTLPILVKHLKMPCEHITVMDFEDKAREMAPWVKKGIRWVCKRITRANMPAVLAKYLKAGDLLIDLAWNIDCCEILQWCHDRGVLYVNTSTEEWDPYAGAHVKPPQERTLYSRGFWTSATAWSASGRSTADARSKSNS